jgi:hypothetical protein
MEQDHKFQKCLTWLYAHPPHNRHNSQLGSPPKIWCTSYLLCSFLAWPPTSQRNITQVRWDAGISHQGALWVYTSDLLACPAHHTPEALCLVVFRSYFLFLFIMFSIYSIFPSPRGPWRCKKGVHLKCIEKLHSRGPCYGIDARMKQNCFSFIFFFTAAKASFGLQLVALFSARYPPACGPSRGSKALFQFTMRGF